PPLRIRRIVAEEPIPKDERHRRGAERQPGVSGLRLLDHVDREETESVDTLLVEFRPRGDRHARRSWANVAAPIATAERPRALGPYRTGPDAVASIRGAARRRASGTSSGHPSMTPPPPTRREGLSAFERLTKPAARNSVVSLRMRVATGSPARAARRTS